MPRPCFLENRAYYETVEVLNSLELQAEVAVVSGFVACLNVQEHEVAVPQRVEGGLHLALVVCVSETCSAFHSDDP